MKRVNLLLLVLLLVQTAICRVSPGKAYVRGYEVETISPAFIDVPKPRTTRTIENTFFPYSTGPTLKLNSVYRSPTVGVVILIFSV